MSVTVHLGDCRDVLPTLPERSVQMVVTSPPYYALRSYLRADDPNKAREIGAEPAPDCLAWARQEPPCGHCYVCTMRQVFGAAWRVLRDDGVLFLNLGDSYGGERGNKTPAPQTKWAHAEADTPGSGKSDTVRKQLLGIPWRVALALQADGWVLRSDVVWAKPNAMPESVQDRPTKAHEYLFLLAKQPRYFYDAAAVAEPAERAGDIPGGGKKASGDGFYPSNNAQNLDRLGTRPVASTRNARTVWTIPTAPYSGAHFAVFPEALTERCMRAGSAAQACPTCGAAWVRVVEREGYGGAGRATDTYTAHAYAQPQSAPRGPKKDFGQPVARDLGFAPACACPGNDGSARSVVLDPFGGSGTTGRVSERLGRDAVLIELNEDYARLHDERLNGVQREMAL